MTGPGLYTATVQESPTGKRCSSEHHSDIRFNYCCEGRAPHLRPTAISPSREWLWSQGRRRRWRHRRKTRRGNPPGPNPSKRTESRAHEPPDRRAPRTPSPPVHTSVTSILLAPHNPEGRPEV
ncbi:hypothetical protein Mapa_015705 [Marchantia paleacea]|nr:hypothetical protein Mapa_015705 [Marchantia paleacea]